MPPPDDSLSLEFQYSELKLKGKTDPDTVTQNIYNYVTESLGLKEDCIVLVQPMPSKFWVQKFVLYCTSQTSKNTLMQKGLDIFGQHVDLEEPGTGVMRIEIQNAPGSMPGHIIQSWLEGYGKVINFDYESYKFKDGKRIPWLNGTRIAHMKEMTGKLPPAITLRWEEKKRNVQIRVWFYGQTDIYCRFCKKAVPKSHKCELAPKKRCFGCGGDGHFINECENSEKGKPASDDQSNKQDNQGKQEIPGSSKTLLQENSFPNIQKGTVKQTVGDDIYSADSESDDSTSRPISKKMLDPMAMFGKKPSKRRRKSGRVRGGIQSTGGEWMTESGSDSETESPSKTDKKKAKKKKSPKKSSLVKGEDDEFKSAISHTDGDQSGEETVPETSKKETPKIVVTGPQEIVVKEKETSKVNPDEDQKEKGADDREVEPMEQDPPPGEKIGAEGKSVTKDQIDGTEEVEYTEWAKQQEVSKVLSSQVNNAAKIEANVLILGGSNSKRAGERLMKISGSSEVKIVTTNFCKGGQKISTMCNKIHNLRKEQKENTSVAIVHVGCVNFPCDKEEVKHNFERYKEEVDMLHQECPNADIVMMGIIPRSGESEFISQANSQIRNFNKNLDVSN